MFRSIKQAIRIYFEQETDPRDTDAISMTVHDCIRLIQRQQRNELSSSSLSSKHPAANMKRNLESIQPDFIKPS